jgi:hypothetical protein
LIWTPAFAGVPKLRRHSARHLVLDRDHRHAAALHREQPRLGRRIGRKAVIAVEMIRE